MIPCSITNYHSHHEHVKPKRKNSSKKLKDKYAMFNLLKVGNKHITLQTKCLHLPKLRMKC